MPNRYYNNATDLLAGTKARASDIEAHFDSITTGFATVQTEMDLKAPLASPALTGTPTAPTATPGTNNTQVATTAFVNATAFSSALPAQSGQGGNYLTTDGVTASWAALALTWGSITGKPTTLSGYGITDAAPINAPTFTGVPAAPTAAADTNTTQLATTAFVIGQASSTVPQNLGAATQGTSLKYARADHVHAAPTYTTQAYGDATTNVATTAFVDALRDVPANSQSASYQLVLADRGRSIDFTGSTGQTITIPANASVAFPVGTVITVTNTTTNNLSIAITSDTLRQAGTANTGTRTLGQYGMVTLRKVSSTVWFISGSGLS